MTENNEPQTDGSEKVYHVQCTNCGDEWQEDSGSHSSGYDCHGCGAGPDERVTLRIGKVPGEVTANP